MLLFLINKKTVGSMFLYVFEYFEITCHDDTTPWSTEYIGHTDRTFKQPFKESKKNLN